MGETKTKQVNIEANKMQIALFPRKKKNKDKYKSHTEKTTLGRWVRGSLSIEITLN